MGWHKVVDGIALIRWLLKKCTKCKKEKIELLILMLANWKSSFTQYDYVTFKSISKDVLKFFILLKRKSSKVSFFWDPSQDMSSRGFPPKKTGLYLVNQSGACFFAGNHLSACPDTDLWTKLTLVEESYIFLATEYVVT